MRLLRQSNATNEADSEVDHVLVEAEKMSVGVGHRNSIANKRQNNGRGFKEL